MRVSKNLTKTFVEKSGTNTSMKLLTTLQNKTKCAPFYLFLFINRYKEFDKYNRTDTSYRFHYWVSFGIPREQILKSVQIQFSFHAIQNVTSKSLATSAAIFDIEYTCKHTYTYICIIEVFSHSLWYVYIHILEISNFQFNIMLLIIYVERVHQFYTPASKIIQTLCYCTNQSHILSWYNNVSMHFVFCLPCENFQQF